MASHQSRDANGFRKPTPTLRVQDETADNSVTPRASVKRVIPAKPLQTSNLSNLPAPRNVSKEHSSQGNIEDMLDKLRMNESRRPSSTDKKSAFNNQPSQYANNHDARKTSIKKDGESKSVSDTSSSKNNDDSSGSDQYASTADTFEEMAKAATVEMDRIKWELEAAKAVISQQKRELDEKRSSKSALDQYPSTNGACELGRGEARITSMHNAFNANVRPFSASNWPTQESEPFSPTINPAEAVRHAFGNPPVRSAHLKIDTNAAARELRPQGLDDASLLYGMNSAGYYDVARGAHLAQRTFSSGSSAAMSPTLPPFNDVYHTGAANRRPISYGTNYGQASGYGATGMEPLSPNISQATLGTDLAMQLQLNHNMINNGRPLHTVMTPSPTASEFNLGQGIGLAAPYTAQTSGHTYVTPLEPMNYRRLLDKSVSCDWKYIVDKIVCNNDQQASIFLQQKLKVGTAEQKFDIVEAIINQAYPLMINRFGNFLVQRCFEHSTPDQVIAIADAIHGNVISLSMDPFGCHVVQKAFDSVPENHKADMVRELLRRIPDTVIHRYACHVWQKLFELRWSGEPPQIMAKVNDALQGMWHEVALGETGSLVVQNIFENCVEEEKRPAIEEVVANIDLISHGQFGNWCIQHLCEHGAPPDKRRVIDHILVNAYSYSIDQYASKVVEKCLKISGIEFLDRYLTVITTSHPDRPRIPLIDIAGDQYGNYLIQWILMNTHQQQREQVAIHIRKHMVSLRGSKFGSRVAMLCCNPASATRPGPGAMVNPFGAPGQPRTQYARFR